MSLSVYQQKIRLPHTCTLPEDFLFWPNEQQACFATEYAIIAQKEYDLRQRVAQGDPDAWQQYQQEVSQAVRLYFQKKWQDFISYTEEVLHNLWESITPEKVLSLWGDAMIDLVNAIINLSLLVLVNPRW